MKIHDILQTWFCISTFHDGWQNSSNRKFAEEEEEARDTRTL